VSLACALPVRARMAMAARAVARSGVIVMRVSPGRFG
jgi:hypothetical protein